MSARMRCGAVRDEGPTNHSLCAGVPCAPYSPGLDIYSVSIKTDVEEGSLGMYHMNFNRHVVGDVTIVASVCLNCGLGPAAKSN